MLAQQVLGVRLVEQHMVHKNLWGFGQEGYWNSAIDCACYLLSPVGYGVWVRTYMSHSYLLSCVLRKTSNGHAQVCSSKQPEAGQLYLPAPSEHVSYLKVHYWGLPFFDVAVKRHSVPTREVSLPELFVQSAYALTMTLTNR